MREVRRHSFQKSIQKTLFANAIIPIFVLLVAMFCLSRALLYEFVERGCRQKNAQIAAELESLCAGYAAELDALSGREDVARALRSGDFSRALYQELYDFVNSQAVRADFFFFNEDLEPLAASTKRTPAYLTQSVLGARAQQRTSPQSREVSVTWESAGSEYKSALLFGAQAGQDGYILFHIPAEKLQPLVEGRGSLSVLLTDGLNYVSWATDGALVDAYARIVPEVRRVTGPTEHGMRRLYVCSTGIFDGRIYVYTVSETTVFASAFKILACAMFAVLALMAAMVFAASRRIARDKTRVIGQIVDTMRSVPREALFRPLVIDTGDEFEEIANTYNDMCREIQTLMRDNAEAAREQVRSEIRQLESQFNPHFLFNTLETIKFLARIDVQQAQLAIVKLSEILRYSLSSAGTWVKLTDEIHYADCYLALQKLRFGDQLQYEIQVGEREGEISVPKLILQPLVENAIRYSGDGDGTRRVSIRSGERDGALIIDVRDGGTPLTDAQLERVRALIARPPEQTGHVGLYNVHRRIQLIYRAQGGVSVHPGPDGNTFRITLPVGAERSADC